MHPVPPLVPQIGVTTEPCVADVSVRDTMAYAAGVEDGNPRYLDDLSDVVAPPAFCSSLEWPATIRLRQALDLSREEALRGVHASQDSTFHAPIRPGERVRTTGRLVHVRETRAGAFVLVRFEIVADATDEPRTTTHAGFLYRGVPVEGDSEVGEAPEIDSLPLPEKTETRTMHGRREAAHVYTECARIWNPIHTEREVARAAGLPDIILHGTALWAIVAREVIDRWGGGEPSRLRRLSGRFRAMVIPGTSIALEHAEPDDEGRVSFVLHNAEGAPAIADGLAVLS